MVNRGLRRRGLKRGIVLESPLQPFDELAVQFDQIEPVFRRQQSDNPPSDRPRARPDLQNPRRTVPSRERACDPTRQKSAAWQDSSCRLKPFPKLPKER
jgi:hypothetical protein